MGISAPSCWQFSFSKLAFISISAFELNQTQDGSFKIGKAFRSNSEPKHGDISQTRWNERSFGETNRKKYCYFVRFSNRRHNCFLLWSGKTQEGRIRRMAQNSRP